MTTTLALVNLLLMHILVLLSAATLLAQSPKPKTQWMAGDFHQHTFFTDGSNPLRTVYANGAKFGLSWQTNSEHGGRGARNGDGQPWDAGITLLGDQIPNPDSKDNRPAMWRWQMLRDFAFPAVQAIRRDHPGKLLLTGLEWNLPGHEHCSTAIVSTDAQPIAQFEYLFDASDRDVSGGLSQGWTGKLIKNDHAKALAAAEWMQKNHAGHGYMVPAHPERGDNYHIEDFRDLNNAGPDVAIGFEGLPGHQKEKLRGGYSQRSAGGGTYGGAGIFIAEIGGLWDALLGEGRRWWIFVNSDFHSDAGDFWPGEYAKTWLHVVDKNNDGQFTDEEVVQALHSGNAFAVHGDLIDSLDFQAHHKRASSMGETLTVKPGATVDLLIRYRSPARNHHGDSPQVHHVDVITGDLTGKVAPDSPNYKLARHPSTKMAASYPTAKARQSGGHYIVRHRFRNVRGDFYVRLRGTNHAPNTPHETDARGNPLPDGLATENLKVDQAEEAWRDLWFYSNPIFVRVQP